MSAYPSTLPFVIPYKIFSSFRFSHLVMSNSLCPRKCSTPGFFGCAGSSLRAFSLVVVSRRLLSS